MNRAAFAGTVLALVCVTAATTGGTVTAIAVVLGDNHGTAIPMPYAYAWAILTTAAGTFIPDVMRFISPTHARR